MRQGKYTAMETLVEKIYDEGCEHPTVPQMFIEMAVKCLTGKQAEVWELHQYDRMTQDEIATKLGKARTTVETQIKQAEHRIKKWCAGHMEVYELLKKQEERNG